MPAAPSDAKVTYEGDCQFDGWPAPRRRLMQAQFAAVTRTDTGVSDQVWQLTLNQPVEPLSPRP